jgi:hypothetical protein
MNRQLHMQLQKIVFFHVSLHLKDAFHMELNLCHPWMKWTNYDLQGKLQELNSNTISTKAFNVIEPQKANQTLLQASLDPSLMIQC